MDPVTQAVFGATAALIVRPKNQSPKAALLLGVAAGMAPDLDVLIRSSHDPLLHIEYHRHFTHSLFFVPIGALMVAAGLWWLLKRFSAWELGSFRGWWGVACLAMLTHAPLDMGTSYGTSFLWPFSDARLDWSVVAVIDPLVTLPMIVALIIGWKRRSEWLYSVAAVYAVAYLCLGWAHRLHAESEIAEIAQQRGHQPVFIQAKPALFVNFLWRTIYVYDGSYYVDAVRLKWFDESVVYEGDSVAVYSPEADRLGLAPDSQQFKDIQRFEHFSQTMLYQVPGDPFLVSDIRYSKIPNSIEPLWAIRIDPTISDAHVEYINFRDVTDDMKQQFWMMIKGER